MLRDDREGTAGRIETGLTEEADEVLLSFYSQVMIFIGAHMSMRKYVTCTPVFIHRQGS